MHTHFLQCIMLGAGKWHGKAALHSFVLYLLPHLPHCGSFYPTPRLMENSVRPGIRSPPPFPFTTAQRDEVGKSKYAPNKFSGNYVMRWFIQLAIYFPCALLCRTASRSCQVLWRPFGRMLNKSTCSSLTLLCGSIFAIGPLRMKQRTGILLEDPASWSSLLEYHLSKSFPSPTEILGVLLPHTSCLCPLWQQLQHTTMQSWHPRESGHACMLPTG